VSSEGGSDRFSIFCNEKEIINDGGIFSEKKNITINLNTGNNVIKFEYSKDGSVSYGEDLAKIDNLVYRIREYTAPIIRTNNKDDYNVRVSIIYPEVVTKKLYSIDNGNTWKNYNGAFDVTSGTLVYAKYLGNNDEDSDIASLIANYNLGSEIEDFESNDLIFDFEGDWERTKDYKMSGRYSYRSKKIGGFESSVTVTNIIIPDDGTEYNLYFDYLVSSEEGHDIFSVYVNGTKVLNVSGERNSYLEIPLEVGNNVVVFEYKKDQTLDLGYDLALIDNMQLKLRGLTNPVITNENSSTANKLKVKIIWPSNAYKKEYSIDGDNWNEYIDVFEVDTNTIIYAKYTTGTNLTSPIVSREVVYSYGSEIENFETEDFVFSYMGEWYRTKEHVINDRFSLINKKIGGNQQTTEIMEFTVPNDGYDYILYFNYRVSSEGGIDRFRVIYN